MQTIIQPQEEKQSIWKTTEDAVRLNQEFLNKNNGNLSSLPSFVKFKGERVAEAYVNEAVFFDPRKAKTDGLYTYGAAECILIVASVKNPYSGEIENIGLTHLNSFLLKNNIGNLEEFFKKLTEKTHGSVEISILSGGSIAALSVFETCKKFGEIKFMNFDFENDKMRVDAAIVDKQGNVYHRAGYLQDIRDVRGKDGEEFDYTVFASGKRQFYHHDSEGEVRKIFETVKRKELLEFDAPENLKARYFEAP